ncbi:ead/Ea22-like family protein [Escherichia coli]|uniref:ead/Ea22-like family protein n=1 Tax=Escherichia coli TaxID=562 RepID=UPI000BE51994|nr:ead/Ea22-like family protein [Escherichia coli]
MSEIDYQALRERYSPKPVPECSVCGEEMSIQRISGAQVVYACSGYGDDGDFKIGRTLADEHYEKSRVTVLDVGDPEVLALLDWLETKDNRIAELEKIATDYALKFQKAQDALKYAVLMRNKALSFEEAMQCTKEKYEGVIKKLAKNEHPVSPIPKPENDKFTVSIPDPKEYFINGVFQPLRYERDVERAIIKAGGKVSWQEAEDN